MTVTYHVQDERLAHITELTGSSRKRLYSAAAYSVRVLVKAWLAKAARSRHLTANRLGATPTGRLEDAAAQVTSEATSSETRVTIPTPGISRAYAPLHIVARAAGALTIPISLYSYAKRASELKATGWLLFRPRKGNAKGILYGKSPADDKAYALYALRRSVVVPQDRGLMPGDDAVAETAARSMIGVIANA